MEDELMDPVRTSFKWAEKIAHWVEQVIFIRVFDRINDFKESLLVSLIKRYWPRWLGANQLTYLRLVIAGLLLVVILLEDYRGNWKVILFFFLAALTDLFDGPVARAFGTASDRGALLDKLADRALVIPLGIAEFWQDDPWLIAIGIAGVTFAYLVALVNYFRESPRGVPDNIFGKSSMFFFSAAAFFAIWPSCWLVADRLGWFGVFCGLCACCVSAKRLFYILQGEG